MLYTCCTQADKRDECNGIHYECGAHLIHMFMRSQDFAICCENGKINSRQASDPS